MSVVFSFTVRTVVVERHGAHCGSGDANDTDEDRKYHRRVVVRSETARKRWRAWWIDDAHGRGYNPAQKQNIAAATCVSRKDDECVFLLSVVLSRGK